MNVFTPGQRRRSRRCSVSQTKLVRFPGYQLHSSETVNAAISVSLTPRDGIIQPLTAHPAPPRGQRHDRCGRSAEFTHASRPSTWSTGAAHRPPPRDSSWTAMSGPCYDPQRNARAKVATFVPAARDGSAVPPMRTWPSPRSCLSLRRRPPRSFLAPDGARRRRSDGVANETNEKLYTSPEDPREKPSRRWAPVS